LLSLDFSEGVRLREKFEKIDDVQLVCLDVVRANVLGDMPEPLAG